MATGVGATSSDLSANLAWVLWPRPSLWKSLPRFPANHAHADSVGPARSSAMLNPEVLAGSPISDAALNSTPANVNFCAASELILN